MLVDDLIKNILRINSILPFIELGGCGHFSYLLHNKLKEKYGIESEIVYEYGPHENCEIQFSHILIKINGKVIDNQGVYDYSDSYLPLDIDTLSDLINRKDIWNQKFHTGWINSYTFKWEDPKIKLKESIDAYI